MPLPLTYFGKIHTVLSYILIMLYKCVAHLLEKICTAVTELRQVINNVHYKVEPVNLILNPHIEGRRDGTLLKVAVYA